MCHGVRSKGKQFAVAWWLWIDANVFSVNFNNDVPVLFVHYLPGIFGSIALVMYAQSSVHPYTQVERCKLV